LGFVESKSVNSQSKQAYSYRDSERGKYGTRYYRLRQTDLDGTMSYSATRPVSFAEGLQANLLAYPNPFREDLVLEVQAEKDAQMEVQLHDALGRLVESRKVALTKGLNTVAWHLSDTYPEGLYVITARYNGFEQRVKVVKKK
jgi:hypothetical protein